MGENTDVEYVDHSFSPWWGCARISPGCRNCFADANAARWGQGGLWHRNGRRKIVAEDTWRKPLRWNREAERAGRRQRILNGTMCDVFEEHPAVAAARARNFRLIEQTPWLLWFMFTKRPENVPAMVPWGSTWPDNAGLITSVENQPYADERIPLLFATAAPVKGLSVEPMLGPVDLSAVTCASCRGDGTTGGEPCPSCKGIGTGPGLLDWVIIGGESGQNARPMHPQWARDLYEQCRAAGTPVWFKQWGTWGPAPWAIRRTDGEPWQAYKTSAADGAATHLYPADAHQHHHRLICAGQPPWEREHAAPPPGMAPLRRWGKGKAGHLLGGREITELPAAAHLTPSARAA